MNKLNTFIDALTEEINKEYKELKNPVNSEMWTDIAIHIKALEKARMIATKIYLDE